MQLTYSAEIEAIRTDAGFSKPVVALESTIITHGMPYPQNLDVARAVEQEVRDAGAVPATIAILTSRADMAFVMAQGKSGATTVAATMIAAQAAGIEVFATGGIGGVHRGAELTFDVSADLRELALSAVIVVAAGAKAILDIPKTMEVLETYGVPVIAYGQDEMPAFWSQKSDIPAPLRCDTPQQIVAGLRARQALGLSGGQLIANPVPKANEISAEEIDPMIELALHEAHRQGINAKAVTPFLLSRIFELTEGKSLQTNIALVKNNARLAAQIAKSCWELPKS